MCAALVPHAICDGPAQSAVCFVFISLYPGKRHDHKHDGDDTHDRDHEDDDDDSDDDNDDADDDGDGDVTIL